MKRISAIELIDSVLLDHSNCKCCKTGMDVSDHILAALEHAGMRPPLARKYVSRQTSSLEGIATHGYNFSSMTEGWDKKNET